MLLIKRACFLSNNVILCLITILLIKKNYYTVKPTKKLHELEKNFFKKHFPSIILFVVYYYRIIKKKIHSKNFLLAEHACSSSLR